MMKVAEDSHIRCVTDLKQLTIKNTWTYTYCNTNNKNTKKIIFTKYSENKVLRYGHLYKNGTAPTFNHPTSNDLNF